MKKRQAEAISAAGSTADVLATNLRRMSVVEVVELQGQCCGASL